MPQREISVKSAMKLAWCIYAYYGLLYPWLQRSWIPEPFILPAEVLKVKSRQIPLPVSTTMHDRLISRRVLKESSSLGEASLCNDYSIVSSRMILLKKLFKMEEW
jgi:hypothetical protein